MKVSLDSSMIPNHEKMGNCDIQVMSSNEDLYLMVNSSDKKRFGVKQRFGIKGNLIPPQEYLQEIMTKKNELHEAKKAEKEVKPEIDSRHCKDPTLVIPLDPDQGVFVFGSSKGVYDDKVRRARGDKRFRLSKEEVLKMIYELFNKQARWSLKALGIETQQPEVYYYYI